MRRTARLLLTAFFPLLSIQVNAQTKRGDLNGDGNVGKEDVTCLIYKILGLAEGNDAYDVNEDGKTDIADVTCLIGIIASNQQGMPFQTCPDDHHPHMIDLGLPSGVKWACCNVGASKPENYGGYYAWGETEVKNDYSFETYIHCDGTQETCHYLGNITGTAYDVAHVKWGEAWRMPTIAERDELIRNCSVETITLYDKFFDKYTGPNGSFIIIPYGGNMYSSINLHEGSDVHSWTSEPLENGQSAHYLYKNGLIGSCLTCMGLTVRPVYDPSFFLLSDETVEIFVNSAASVTIEGGSGEYELQYDQTDIIDAELIMADKEEDPDAKDEISIFGVAEGTATLSVLDKQNNKTATLVVNVKTPTEEDIATTMEYIARVRNYINSLGEISVDVFQSNLLSWLDEQNWVKKVSTYSDDLVTNTSPNGARNLIRGLNDIVGLIEITLENRANLFINFNDMALLGAVDTSGNLNLSSYLKSDVSSFKDEEIIENANVLYIQGRTMPNFKEQNKSTAEKEKNLIQQTKELSPIDFKITTVPKSLSFLDKEKTKIEDYSMILLGQTHGGYSDGSEYAGYFQVEDRLYAGKIANYAIDIIIDNKRAIVKSDDPDNNGAYVIYNVTPFAMKNLNIKEKTIFFGSYCHSYYMQKHIPNTTFFGYSTKENYYEGTGKMADFFHNMSLGMTYKDAIENKDPITNKPNPINKEYDYINQDDETVHVEPATNRPESKQRYFSISTEEVKYSETGTPIIKGQIKGYHNLKPDIQYYVYAYGKNAEFNYSDIVTKGKLINDEANNGEGIYEDGSFSFEYKDQPITQTLEEYNVIVGFLYGGTYYYGPVKTLASKSLCPDNQHPHAIDLGLPSGTKWACCNVGTSAPEEYGLYFAWGETQGYTNDGHSFEWASYKWYNGSEDSMTKYCAYSKNGYNGFTDGLANLLPEDDAATANWGSGWRMPIIEQFKELINSVYTTTEYTAVNGVNGLKITSRSNGNSIFLPAAGLRYETSLAHAGSYGYYWSRSLETSLVSWKSKNAHYVSLDPGGLFSYYGYRFQGQSVRPVRAKK